MLSIQLKEKTKPAHQSLEAVVVRAIKAIRGKEDYVQLLHKFYGFHHPLEQVYDRFFDDQTIPDYSDRRKSSSILDDLQSLNMPVHAIPEATNLPVIQSLGAAFGSYYVIEGSTQGGSIVSDMLIKYAGLTKDNTRFFASYGEASPGMWQSFKDRLDSYSNDPQFCEEAIAGADETFERFRDWMSK